MRNAAHQAQVKVAVIAAQVPSSEAQHQQLQEKVAIALIGFAALVAFSIA